MSTSPQHPQNPQHGQDPGRDTGGPEAADRAPGVQVSEGVAATSGTYQAVSVLLALIVMAALVYGLVQTGLKASALFTG